MTTTVLKNDLILRAAKHEKLERPPVWMMRQAGRYLPEYQAIRSTMSFLELCKNPDKAAEVSIQPLEILGVDAIIMFSDILIPLEPMGADLSFDTGKPEFRTPIRTADQIDQLIVPKNIGERCSFVYETLDEIKKRVAGEVPVLGFAGAPWTLASYLIEGGVSKNFENIKKLMYSEPNAMHILLDKLTETIIDYLSVKIEHGADMLQLFDTWASVLSQKDYKDFALPYQQRIIASLKSRYPGTIITLYVNGVANVLDYMIDSGADVVSIDWRVNLREIREYVASYSDNATARKIAIQGNFDPCFLLGDKNFVERKTLEMLGEAGSAPGYIANLGHGILPMVPPENAKVFINTIKNFSCQNA